jgi:hypothetical protein
MDVTYTPVKELDGLKQALDGLRDKVASDTYFDFHLGSIHAFVSLHLSEGVLTVRYNDVGGRNAPVGVRTLFEQLGKDLKAEYSFVDAHQVTKQTAERAMSMFGGARSLKGTSDAEAKEFVEKIPEKVPSPRMGG